MNKQVLPIFSNDKKFCNCFGENTKIQKYGIVYFVPKEKEDRLYNISLELPDILLSNLRSISLYVGKVVWTTVNITKNIKIDIDNLPVKDLYLENIYFILIYKKPTVFTTITISYNYDTIQLFGYECTFFSDGKWYMCKLGKCVETNNIELNDLRVYK